MLTSKKFSLDNEIYQNVWRQQSAPTWAHECAYSLLRRLLQINSICDESTLKISRKSAPSARRGVHTLLTCQWSQDDNFTFHISLVQIAFFLRLPTTERKSIFNMTGKQHKMLCMATYGYGLYLLRHSVSFLPLASLHHPRNDSFLRNNVVDNCSVALTQKSAHLLRAA